MRWGPREERLDGEVPLIVSMMSVPSAAGPPRVPNGRVSDPTGLPHALHRTNPALGLQHNPSPPNPGAAGCRDQGGARARPVLGDAAGAALTLYPRRPRRGPPASRWWIGDGDDRCPAAGLASLPQGVQRGSLPLHPIPSLLTRGQTSRAQACWRAWRNQTRPARRAAWYPAGSQTASWHPTRPGTKPKQPPSSSTKVGPARAQGP